MKAGLRADELNWTELTYTKLTQLHGVLLVTRASASRSRLAAVGELKFNAIQFSLVHQLWTRLNKHQQLWIDNGTAQWRDDYQLSQMDPRDAS